MPQLLLLSGELAEVLEVESILEPLCMYIDIVVDTNAVCRGFLVFFVVFV